MSAKQMKERVWKALLKEQKEWIEEAVYMHLTAVYTVAFVADIMGTKNTDGIASALSELAKEGKVELTNKEPPVYKIKNPAEIKDIYSGVHRMKGFAVNMVGYSKLLSVGEYGKLTQKQKDILSTVIEEGDALMTSLTELLNLHKKKAMNKSVKNHMVNIGIIADWFLKYSKLNKKEKDMMNSIKKNADDARGLI